MCYLKQIKKEVKLYLNNFLMSLFLFDIKKEINYLKSPYNLLLQFTYFNFKYFIKI